MSDSKKARVDPPRRLVGTRSVTTHAIYIGLAPNETKTTREVTLLRSDDGGPSIYASSTSADGKVVEIERALEEVEGVFTLEEFDALDKKLAKCEDPPSE